VLHACGFASRLRPVSIAVALVVSILGCRGAPPSSPPNVLLVVVDALRADHLGAYGYSRPTSPNFDALARAGVLYTRAHAPTSWTNPSVAALFSGERPRVLEPGAAQYIPAEVTTLAEAFQAAGYRTGAVVGNLFLAPDLGFAQGFDDYTPAAPWVHGIDDAAKQPAERLNALGLTWLETAVRDPSRPWFLYVHYMDPHWPYVPPLETARRFWRAGDIDVAAAMQPLNRRVRQEATLSATEVAQSVDLYDGAIAHFDAQLGELLAALRQRGALAHTVVCVTADHGEEFADHGGFRHARTLYEEVLHIPLAIAGSGRVARVDTPVQNAQIGATLLALAGVSASGFAGRGLDSGDVPAALLAELTPWAGAVHRQALLRGDDKLIVTVDGRRLLFDLRADPGEAHDVAAARPRLVDELGAALAGSAASRPSGVPATPNAAVRERMRALGYDF